jgi:hypothetical protein
MLKQPEFSSADLAYSSRPNDCRGQHRGLAADQDWTATNLDLACRRKQSNAVGVRSRLRSINAHVRSTVPYRLQYHACGAVAEFGTGSLDRTSGG